ncbi:MAG: glycosyltransferase [Ignavibacteria bacterium]|nr:glycosyltransferase [Ignavibacteria bacterium]
MYELTAILIVKNGEEHIANALESVLPVVKQIVVVDTGSADRTPIIASRFGAEVHFFEWENDFSKARNYGLQFARYPWILVLDHDEVLNQKTLIDNFHLTNQPNVGGLRVKITNHIKRGDSYTKTHHTYTRIFRNHPQIRFEGPIHEQIAQSILDAGFEIVETDIQIDHYGYSSINIDKVSRNRKILEKVLEENPDDDWALFNLAESEFSIGNIDKAQSLYERLVGSFQLNPEQIEMVRIRLGQIALKRDEFRKVYHYCDFTSEDKHREGLRLLVWGTALLMEHRFDEAKKIFDKPELQISDMVDKNQIKNALEVISLVSQKF